MSNDGFKFSRDKRFGRVSFAEFLAVARSLARSVSALRPGVAVEVVTAEDRTTYHYATTTFFSDEIANALKNRKGYALSELTREVWARSFDVELTLRDRRDAKSFMICVSCDKHADGGRMRFYGQGLDKEIRRSVLDQFHRATFAYRVGDGMVKISDFNLAMGRILTGIPFSS